jgi:hypothetical protein
MRNYKKILILIFLPQILFSQESQNFNLSNEYSNFSENNDIEPKDRFLSSLFPFTVLLADVAINIGMREGIYKNNHQDNWWGTVNGALTLGLGGTIIFGSISYGIFKITDGKFDEKDVIISTLLGLAGGVTMAFFPPFKQAFRENAFLYYSYPTLFGVALGYVIIDIWIGKNNEEKKFNFQLAPNSLMFHWRL